jgi:hypothetical protein
MFGLAFYMTRMIETAIDSIVVSRQAIEIMSDPDLGDLEKEKLVQKAAVGMMQNCGFLFLKGCITILAVGTPILFADLLQLASIEETSRFALRWDVLVLTSVGMIVPVMLIKKRRFMKIF